MGKDGDSVDEDEDGERRHVAPDPDDVARRAEGRPPEERSSEDPTAQAEAILEDSEDRVSEGSERSMPDPSTGPEP